MIINKQQMEEINSVQYEIFKAFHSACEILNVKYYLVHGSLLGALRYKGFCPMDDDIDVAMLRKDYNLFMAQGQQYMDTRFFVQSHLTERDYPMLFGKVRATETAFIQPALNDFNINKGIYIDVFPIDNYPTNEKQLRKLVFKSKLYSTRVNQRFKSGMKQSIKSKILGIIGCFIMPSWQKTRDKLCALYSKVSPTGKIVVYGGKTKEIGVPFELFGAPVRIQFGDILSYAPQKTKQYLELIYGDYLHYDPMGKDMVSENEVKISADIVDVNKSYKEYIK